jgi:hypothetical protein
MGSIAELYGHGLYYSMASPIYLDAAKISAKVGYHLTEYYRLKAADTMSLSSG